MDIAGTKNVQWLERATFTYQMKSTSALAIGLRRILGAQPILIPPPPSDLCSI